MTQAALARALEISPSYLNQIEQNARPLTVPVLLRLNAVFGLDVQLFSDADEARLITDLRAALADQGTDVALAEVRELASNMPAIARSIVAMQRRLRDTAERADLLAGRIESPGTTPAAFEAVRDWFYERRNHVAELDLAAEAIGDALPPGRMAPGLIDRLVYARGLDLGNPGTAIPIGPGCKVCERRACPQRAFPMVGRPLAASPGEARFAPYSGAG